MKATYSTKHLLLLCAALLAGCATRPTATPIHTWTTPNDTAIVGVKNFGKVSPQIWRGAQPTEEGFINLERAGVKTILNLRSEHDDLKLLSGTKLKYVRIPMRAWDPDQGEVGQLALVMTTLDRLRHDPSSWPVFIHCAAGKDRTGYSVATYRMAFQNWSPNDAIEEMFDYHFNTVWFRNPAFLQRLDIEDLRAHIKKAP
ncbi:MAG: tyrosine-protein phosphatase [Verrucomicrobiota bacterium]|jgi:protein tyrosine/serine phosphatase